MDDASVGLMARLVPGSEAVLRDIGGVVQKWEDACRVEKSGFFDDAASAAMTRAAISAQAVASLVLTANVNSVHEGGANVKRVDDSVKSGIASLVRMPMTAVPETCVHFTPGGAAANLFVLQHMIPAFPRNLGGSVRRDVIILGRIEHPSILHVPVIETLKKNGYEVVLLDIMTGGARGTNPRGIMGEYDPAHLTALIEKHGAERIALLSTHHANSEIGTVQDLRTLNGILRERCPDAVHHADCIQTFGKLPIDMTRETGNVPVDAISVSFHKVGGPKGCGAVLLASSALLRKQKLFKATTDVSAHVASYIAAEAACRGMPAAQARCATLAAQFLDGLRALCGPEMVGHGGVPAPAPAAADEALPPPAEEEGEGGCEIRMQYKVLSATAAQAEGACVPGFVNVSFPALQASHFVTFLGAIGVRVSSGSACSSQSDAASHVVASLNMHNRDFYSAVRFSFSASLPDNAVSNLLGALKSVFAKLKPIQTAELAKRGKYKQDRKDAGEQDGGAPKDGGKGGGNGGRGRWGGKRRGGKVMPKASDAATDGAAPEPLSPEAKRRRKEEKKQLKEKQAGDKGAAAALEEGWEAKTDDTFRVEWEERLAAVCAPFHAAGRGVALPTSCVSYDAVMVTTAELCLKGGKRADYERRQVLNIVEKLRTHAYTANLTVVTPSGYPETGFFMLMFLPREEKQKEDEGLVFRGGEYRKNGPRNHLPMPLPARKVTRREYLGFIEPMLKCVPGLANMGPVDLSGPSVAAVEAQLKASTLKSMVVKCLEYPLDTDRALTFGLKCRRTNRDFPVKSDVFQRQAGGSTHVGLNSDWFKAYAASGFKVYEDEGASTSLDAAPVPTAESSADATEQQVAGATDISAILARGITINLRDCDVPMEARCRSDCCIVLDRSYAVEGLGGLPDGIDKDKKKSSYKQDRKEAWEKKIAAEKAAGGGGGDDAAAVAEDNEEGVDTTPEPSPKAATDAPEAAAAAAAPAPTPVAEEAAAAAATATATPAGFQPVTFSVSLSGQSAAASAAIDGALTFGDHLAVLAKKKWGASAENRVLSLLSGGHDSPVASLKVMTRGCQVGFVHFDGYPYTPKEVVTKVRRIAQRLNGMATDAQPLYVVPFSRIQELIARTPGVPSSYRTVLYRVFMFRIAEMVAERTSYSALLTGDNVGQVASQTLANLTTLNELQKLFVMRPLIAHSKAEIMEVLDKHGLFELTKMHGTADCCTVFKV